MRKPAELDHLFENAVAVALGLDKPHPEVANKVRTAPRKISGRGHLAALKLKRERLRVAA